MKMAGAWVHPTAAGVVTREQARAERRTRNRQTFVEDGTDDRSGGYPRGVVRLVLVVTFALLAVAIGPDATTAMAPDRATAQCERPAGVQPLVFSAAKYPNIRRHFRRAVLRRGSPLRLVVNRPYADERRERLLRDIPMREGFDRDKYPPAVGRGRGPGLERGRNPRGWKADVRYVPASENRSHGASLGAQLEPFCNGTRFQYVFR
jgi:hypothetical protein